MSAEGKRVGSWDTRVGVWRSLFGVECLSYELCGVHDHEILSCCHIPGNSLDITNMLHGKGCVAGILFWFLRLLMLFDGCCVFSSFMIVSSLCFDWVCSLCLKGCI